MLRDGQPCSVAGAWQAGIGQEPFLWLYAAHRYCATSQGAGEEGEAKGPAWEGRRVLLYLCTQNTCRMVPGLPQLPWTSSAGMSVPARLPEGQDKSQAMSSPGEPLYSHACSSVRLSCKKAKLQEGDSFGRLQFSSFMPAYSCLLITISPLLHLPVVPPCHPRPLPRDI